MLKCIKEIYSNKDIKKNEIVTTIKMVINTRTVKSISKELYKRLILPFYTLIIALYASLVIEPKSKY